MLTANCWLIFVLKYILILVIPLTLALPINEDPSPPKLVTSFCSFGNNQYDVGETWNPIVQPFGVQPCINCTCGEDGGVTCKAPKCAATDCDRPRTPAGQCCPTCDGNPPISNIPPRPPIREPGRKKCRHDGQVYRHNQKFSSQKTALRPYRPNQCVQCVCLDGEVLCHLKSCPVLMCETRAYTTADCCPVCTEGGRGIGLPLKPVDGRKSNAHCKTGGVRYPHGTTWHPIIGDFGRMDCVLCSCKNAEITCEKLKCPSADQLPCDHPRRQPGQCCKACPSSSATPIPLPTQTTPNLRNQTVITGGKDVLRACPTGRSDTLVLKSKTSKLFTILFENIRKNTVEMFQWGLSKGKTQTFVMEQFTAGTFRKIFAQQNHKYEIIGASRKKYVLRFRRRIEKYMRRCKQQCTRKRIQTLLGRLRLTKVHYRTKC